MTNKAVFSNVNHFTNESVRLNLGAISYVYIFLNLNKRADKDATTYRTPIKVDWVD